jgi:hypothetical protein
MLFDRADALKSVVDFLAEPGDVLEFFSEVVEIPADLAEFGVDRREGFRDSGADVYSRGHCGFDIGNVFSNRSDLLIGRC